MCLRALLLFGICALSAFPADPIAPVTVCAVLGDLAKYDGQEVAVLGRYSFRKDGRWMGEETCAQPSGPTPMLWLSEDAAGGPKPPGNLELDAAALNRGFADMAKRTKLGKFRFGTSDYDRWAVVYGRVVSRKGDAARKAPADLVFRGSGVVIFLTTEQ